MGTVIFKTENAVFEFSRKAVMENLRALITEHDDERFTELMELIKTSGEETILIPDEHIYIVLDLIAAEKGYINCKRCDKTYNNSQLKSFALGAGKSPLSLNIDIQHLPNLFRSRKRNPSMMGGSGYNCPAGHELIMLVTWRT
jgi:hypothetical protein